MMIAALLLSWPAVSAAPQEGRGPLKVFIFGGQSNMEGYGSITAKDDAGNERPGTLVSMLKDPGKAPLIRHLLDARSQWVERDDVWVYNRTYGGVGKGRLKPGYGAGPDEAWKAALQADPAKSALRQGLVWERLREAAGRRPSPALRKEIEAFAAQAGDSFYGREAKAYFNSP